MSLDEPVWWYSGRHQWIASALAPLGSLYGLIAARRIANAKPYRCSLPVICVGNFTAGGTGKTPLSLYLAECLAARGERPVFLTRGYGGRLPGPVLVDPSRHTAEAVGDEPLLLAANARTVVARHRAAGAMMIENQISDASVIIMDDGLQNASLAKDLVIAVVDRKRGIGNGRCIPAGPLRAPMLAQVALVDAIALNLRTKVTPSTQSDKPAWLERSDCPILAMSVVPRADTSWLKDAHVVAFAGIGAPDRFFDMLASSGARIAGKIVFPDHHALTQRDAETILAACRRTGAIPVTTEKDRVRFMTAPGPLAELVSRTKAVGIELSLSTTSEIALSHLLDKTLAKKA